MPLSLDKQSEWHSWFVENGLNDKIQYLINFIEEKRGKGVRIFPPENQLFRAWECTPLEQVKVVILGQDPYHGIGQANGLAFSVNKGIGLPPSLRNIFTEVQRDIPGTEHLSGDLTSWASQGVFLINTILSVEEGKPLSHKNKGWEEITTATLLRIAQQQNPIVFMLWGSKAHELLKDIEIRNHLVLTSTHPSPLSVYRGFNGCSHFSKANLFLQDNGITPIDWSIR
jgi:uracil-DNA glycosylase